MMAHADYFVGSSTSGIPIIIATLRMTVYMKPQVMHRHQMQHTSPSYALTSCSLNAQDPFQTDVQVCTGLIPETLSAPRSAGTRHAQSIGVWSRHPLGIELKSPSIIGK